MLTAVVGSLMGDRYVVRMAFDDPGGGDFQELCLLKIVHIFLSGIAHARPETAYHLVDDF
jgi:hypothetical protein